MSPCTLMLIITPTFQVSTFTSLGMSEITSLPCLGFPPWSAWWISQEDDEPLHPLHANGLILRLSLIVSSELRSKRWNPPMMIKNPCIVDHCTSKDELLLLIN